MPLRLVTSLDESWRATLDAVARERRFPTSEEVPRLARLVERLSAMYNDRSAKPPDAGDRDALAARLLFSFARDVPKGAGAVRELVAAGLLSAALDRPLRVLDVGAGLGAMTWGVARAIERAGRPRSIEADLVDHHRGALDLAEAVARARRHADLGGPSVVVRARVGSAERPHAAGGAYDLVLLGQVLSELDRDASDDERVVRHEALVRRWFEHVGPEGSLVIVEPALRDRSRHLHRVRAALLASGSDAPIGVFAPCLHHAACPMLVREHDWCHEDLPIDLPEWLAPVARAAGLRTQGLTFSYLVLRRDRERASPFASVHNARSVLRDVSGLRRTKGKSERVLCGRTAGMDEGGGLRTMRLERAASAANAVWDEAGRGDVLTFEPALDAARPRVEEATRVAFARWDEPSDASDASAPPEPNEAARE
jgi:ribosomal protein RSM22 (predicted rRNA methylase)